MKSLAALLLFVMLIPVAVRAQILPPDASLERVAQGFQFTKGPAFDGKGNLWFTDIGDDRIMSPEIATGMLDVQYENSGLSNGLMFDNQGRLVVAEM